MWKIFGCIISGLLISYLSFAQQKSTADTTHAPVPIDSAAVHGREKDSTRAGKRDSVITVQHGLRAGIDLSRFVMPYLQPDRRDIELSADMEIRQNLYGVAEGGYNKVSIDKGDLFRYRSKGYFFRLGVDYNWLAPSYPGEKNIVYGGVRAAHAQFRHGAPDYLITDSLWGDIHSSIPMHSVSANWLEFVAGIKIEVLNNFFIGWSLRVRVLMNKNTDRQLPPYIIPGFGKGAGNAVFDGNYSVYYRIPLFTDHQKIKRKKAPKPVPKQ